MLLKKIGTSLICTVTMFLLCSTYSYASSNYSSIKSESEQTLVNFEQAISADKSDFNLSNDDNIHNNLKLGEVYPNNVIDTDNIGSSNELSKEVKNTNQYIGTIKLKDSDKPIALAYIENENSKWIIYRLSNYNLLDDEIKNYQKDTNTNDDPTVIMDEANSICALGSDKSGDKIKFIKPSAELSLNKGEFLKVSNLQPKLKAMSSIKMKTTTSAEAELDGGSGSLSVNRFDYAKLIIPSLLLLCGTILLMVRKRHSRYNKAK